jgi:hypothetical protein
VHARAPASRERAPDALPVVSPPLYDDRQLGHDDSGNPPRGGLLRTRVAGHSATAGLGSASARDVSTSTRVLSRQSAAPEPLLFLGDKECEGLALMTRLPEGGANLLNSIRCGKEFRPCLWVHSSGDRCPLVFLARVLVQFYRHLHAALTPIHEF